MCVAAVVVMTWATSLPFMGVPQWWGDALNPSANLAVTTWSLAGGRDTSFVVVTLVVLGVAIGGHVVGIYRRLTAFTCLIASVSALLLALFEVGDGGRRVLPSWTFPSPGGPSAPVSIAAGFYVFRDAAALAVIASLIMLITSLRKIFLSGRQLLHLRPS
jgi:hypothetical protein